MSRTGSIVIKTFVGCLPSSCPISLVSWEGTIKSEISGVEFRGRALSLPLSLSVSSLPRSFSLSNPKDRSHRYAFHLNRQRLSSRQQRSSPGKGKSLSSILPGTIFPTLLPNIRDRHAKGFIGSFRILNQKKLHNNGQSGGLTNLDLSNVLLRLYNRVVGEIRGSRIECWTISICLFGRILDLYSNRKASFSSCSTIFL